MKFCRDGRILTQGRNFRSPRPLPLSRLEGASSTLPSLFSRYVLASLPPCSSIQRAPGSLVTLLALHSSNGNSAAAFTLDGKTGAYDAHRCWEHGCRIFAQGSRQQGIFTKCLNGTRPGDRCLFQDFLPCLPVYFPFSRAPL